jgi:hexosaminidase
MLYPRIASAAEIAWSPARGAHPWRNWDSFAARLAGLAPFWEAQGIGFHRAPGIAWAN